MKKLGFYLLIGLIFLSASQAVFAVNLNNYIEAYGLDTVAGHSTVLRTSKTYTNENLIFKVINPSGEKIEIPAYTNANGVAKVEFSDYYLREAGKYLVSAYLENGFDQGITNVFEVFPDQVSVVDSEINPGDLVLNASKDSGKITITLKDKYGNFIEGHQVKLISSSANDNVELCSYTDVTDEFGEICYRVSSPETGSVTYTAYDSTADVTLTDKLKAVYFDSSDYLFKNNLPGDFEYAAMGASGSAESLEFTDIPDTVEVNSDITFSVTALNPSNLPAIDYTGTVRFSVIDGNDAFVDLPSDYTFTVDDIGTHTFSLAMSFQEIGFYEIEVRDVENTEIFGTYTFDVVRNASADSPGSSAVLSIANPVSGTYSNNVQVISGTAPGGADLKIFDNDIEIGQVSADLLGNFTYTTSPLLDGPHSFHVAQIDDSGAVIVLSSVVDVNIDTAAPEVSNIEIEPSEVVAPGTSVTLKIYVSDVLAQAAVVFADNIYELSEMPEGYYTASFPAPSEAGDYGISLVLVDELGNEGRYNDYGNLTVGTAGTDLVVVDDVTELSATASDNRVTLSWQTPVFTTNPIQNYRVYYGLSPNQLTEAIDTFTASTTWYIPNLENGTEHYFAVIAVDNKGNTSEHFSNIVAATPNPDVIATVPPEVEMGIAGSEIIESELTEDYSDSGPEMLWLFIFSLLGGAFYSYFCKKRFFN